MMTRQVFTTWSSLHCRTHLSSFGVDSRHLSLALASPCKKQSSDILYLPRKCLHTVSLKKASVTRNSQKNLLQCKLVETKQPRAYKFWEVDKKSGYKSKMKRPPLETIKDGAKMIRPEVAKFGEEWKEKIRGDVVMDILPGDYEVVWRFNQENDLNDWILTADSDHSEGKSHGEFVLGKNKTGLFQGNINTDPPKDGKIKRSGYVNIRSPKNFISFKRERPYDWSIYTHLLLRCRGDGRPYQISIGMDRYFDLSWNDQYTFPLYTRGGPYWQVAKIPFSKFFLSHKGRVQDKQESVVHQLHKVLYVGITQGEGTAGPFNLELDYIGVMYDEAHKERFAYEMYQSSMIVHD